MSSSIPLTKPCTGTEEARLIEEVLASGWITGGPKVAEFERRLANYLSVRNAITTTSCTTALSVALHALGIGPGDEVIVPSFSFIATANVVRHAGATPVFADIDLATYNVTAETLAAVLSPRTRAIIPVHQVGLPVDLHPVMSLAAKHDLAVIEDAACALGTEYRRRRIGGHMTCACFSFHPRKVITTGEGGLVTTNDDALAQRIRMLCNHGAAISEMEKHASQKPVMVRYPVTGFNYRMSDLQAACGLAQMAKLDGILSRRRELAAGYTDAFGKMAELVVPIEPEYAKATYQSYMVRLRGATAETRMAFLSDLNERGVNATPGIPAIHRQECYEDFTACRPTNNRLHNTELAADTTVILSLFPDMTADQQRHVVKTVAECSRRFRASAAA